MWYNHPVTRLVVENEPRMLELLRRHALGGAGLRLAIAQWIVQLHKGCVALESQPGNGSVFRLEMPMTNSAVQINSGSK
jgi:signal transduction histidine kinase